MTDRKLVNYPLNSNKWRSGLRNVVKNKLQVICIISTISNVVSTTHVAVAAVKVAGGVAALLGIILNTITTLTSGLTIHSRRGKTSTSLRTRSISSTSKVRWYIAIIVLTHVVNICHAAYENLDFSQWTEVQQDLYAGAADV